MGKNKLNNDFINIGADSIQDEDIKNAADNSEKIYEKIKSSKTLAGYLEDLSLLGSLVKDYWKGNYKTVPYKTIAVIVFTLMYVLNIADVIPDVIPGIGLLDDASVIAFCLKIVGGELNKYKDWKTSNNPVNED